jgi:spore maturation protein CgeB
MKLTIFGLTITSSWGNGHATLWRGLCKALANLGHDVVFFERDVPYYANARDWQRVPGGELVLYSSWDDVAQRARDELGDSDAAIVSSYCPDALAASNAMLQADRPLSVSYDLDTPVTLSRLRAGATVPYIPRRGLRDFEVVLSYTGGAALEDLRCMLGARRVRPLYGHVDPDVHHPVAPHPRFRASLSWLGTYAQDRQAALEDLLVAPAHARPAERFLIGGAQYPDDFPWTSNVYFIHHVPPHEHATFFCSSRLTLNVTRAAMAEMGWCPSGRLFEAAACGAAVLSDSWSGLEEFYTPGEEILVAEDCAGTLAALDREDGELQRIGRRAHERTLDEHTSHHRARVLIEELEAAVRTRGSVAATDAWRTSLSDRPPPTVNRQPGNDSPPRENPRY